ncbi:hypothetical protein HBI56_171840 [Parastagonospora nodorum]|nr:hypothetical protein HBH53_157530 [Parastagonospora nodorum]KAH3963335.1 hypothetical protein HBH51_167180 [Parastagonospora nodorum]KAH3995208.1 hypothetical protein HBI10_175710 [Parastagonospora nodorum]KAH4017529.1 hypothetical protein HBI13_141240 [Parastagonospora nodorum]KAH4063173.1 hypothetical protein HBH50_193300 [Parastagonospora nodorum]
MYSTFSRLLPPCAGTPSSLSGPGHFIERFLRCHSLLPTSTRHPLVHGAVPRRCCVCRDGSIVWAEAERRP